MDSKKGPPRPEGSSRERLERALSSISTREMKAVRAEVESELQAVASTPVPVIPPTAIAIPAGKTEPPQEPERRTLHNSDIEDLQQAGKIASDFLQGMDRVADVLMLLVLKFGRASTLMRAVFIGNIVAFLLLVFSIFALWNLSATQTALQTQQEDIQKQQALILERQRATQVVAGEAQKAAAEATQKVAEVQQKTPEVVIDEKGKAQLILKVAKPEEGASPTKTINPPKKSKIKEGDDDAPTTLSVPL